MKQSLIWIRICLYISLITIATDGRGQTQVLSFNRITGSNGVSLGKINAVTRDKFGFIWMSDQTNRCIVRYDGSHMKRYPYSQGQPNTLGGHYPECLATDSTGIIWIGFYGQGLDRFDPVNNTFTHFKHNDEDPASLSHDFVSAVLVDHLGNVWIGTNDGLDLFESSTGTFKHFRNDPSNPYSLSHNVVRTLYEDDSGVLWVGTGMAFSSDNEGGLNRLDIHTGKFTRYLHDPSDHATLMDNKVRSIFEDSYGNFWVGTRGDGLHKMDRATGTFERLIYDPSNPGQLSRPPVVGSADHITFITEDIERNLWIGTLSNGVVRYNPTTKKSEHFGNAADQSGDYSDNTSWSAYASDDGHVWLTTQASNVFRIDLYNTVFDFLSPDVMVQAFYGESPVVSWWGTTEGLIREDHTTGTRKVIRHNPSDKNSLSANSVTAILKDKNGIFWIGTSNGLNRFDYQANKFTRYLHDPKDTMSIVGNIIASLCEDSKSNLWVGTTLEGWSAVDINSGKITSSFRGTFSFQEIIETQQRYLWIGTDQGMFRRDTEMDTVKFFMSGLNIRTYYNDASDVLWVGTNNGLFRLDREKDEFNSTSIVVGIESVQGDDEGNLWMTSTSFGLGRYNPQDESLIVFGIKSGIYPELVDASTIYRADDERLVVGLGRFGGYYEFHPDKIKLKQESSALYFTGFSVAGKETNFSNVLPGSVSLITTDKIALAYDENIFSIRFTEVDFRNMDGSRILYKLEGYDEEWRQSFAEEPVTYFKVPSGSYAFRIRTDNNSTGRWVEKSLDIFIQPPWWTTWWAYGLYALAFVGGVFIVDKVQRKRIVEKERSIAREKELEQARQIEKAYRELKATQAQLIQSEKMASLGELTAGIAHEIQNPLNFVNNFSEVNNELIDELKTELATGNREMATKITDDIKHNLDKINHHGKRADAIVKSMLQHSRTSSGKEVLTDINMLCDEYLRLAYHGYRAKDKSFNAKFETDFDSSLPKINVVPQEIGRVVLNLINNAFYAVNDKAKRETGDVKGESSPVSPFTFTYEPIVKVSTKKFDDTIQISVKDNGPGIPDSIKEKIFQPFFTTKPTGQGTGLGLSLSYDIIKAHGGELVVETKESVGSVFIITLPVKKVWND